MKLNTGATCGTYVMQETKKNETIAALWTRKKSVFTHVSFLFWPFWCPVKLPGSREKKIVFETSLVHIGTNWIYIFFSSYTLLYKLVCFCCFFFPIKCYVVYFYIDNRCVSIWGTDRSASFFCVAVAAYASDKCARPPLKGCATVHSLLYGFQSNKILSLYM